MQLNFKLLKEKLDARQLCREGDSPAAMQIYLQTYLIFII